MEKGAALLGAERHQRPSCGRRKLVGPRALAARAEAAAAGVQTKDEEATSEAADSERPVAIPSFPAHLRSLGMDPVLRRKELSTLQINIGLYCNQACAHCHVDSSPQRTEMMDSPTAQRIISSASSHWLWLDSQQAILRRGVPSLSLSLHALLCTLPPLVFEKREEHGLEGLQGMDLNP